MNYMTKIKTVDYDQPANNDSDNSVSLTVVSVTEDQEPRVLDTDLAVALGMSRPRDIRKDLIAPNREELEGFGILREMSANSNGKRGRPAKAYYLNEQQALLICLFSRTSTAKQVRAEIIRVFTAWRKGQLVEAQQPNVPKSFSEALRLAADQYEKIEQLTVENKAMEEELTVLTVDEFRSLNHVYLAHGQKTILGRTASKLTKKYGRKRHPDQVRGVYNSWTKKFEERHLRVYDRDLLVEAAESLGLQMK